MQKVYWNKVTTAEAEIVDMNFLDQRVTLQTRNGTKLYMSFDQFEKEWEEKKSDRNL